ncbi:MAG TPA: 30S ribosomal protein S6, partial [Candidatus Portnoybacteria bacterium]|nr:30S ribosomal protein S6 [Candidatus Portnoybacteria bacterium]
MQYELTCLLPTEKSSEITSRIKKELVEIGGKIIKEESVIRKLAYPIKKHEQADYLTIDFDLDSPKKITQLDNKLKSITEIIRYLIIENLLKPIKSTVSGIKKEGVAQDREKTPNQNKFGT